MLAGPFKLTGKGEGNNHYNDTTMTLVLARFLFKLTAQTGPDENFISPIVFGQETFLPISVELLRSNNVVNFGKLLSDAAEAGVLGDDGID